MAGPKDDFYIWWAIVAITLQAKAAAKGRKSALPAEKLFQLAEVMIAKQAQKEGIKIYEQLMLFLDILKVFLQVCCWSSHYLLLLEQLECIVAQLFGNCNTSHAEVTEDACALGLSNCTGHSACTSNALIRHNACPYTLSIGYS